MTATLVLHCPGSRANLLLQLLSYLFLNSLLAAILNPGSVRKLQDTEHTLPLELGGIPTSLHLLAFSRKATRRSEKRIVSSSNRRFLFGSWSLQVGCIWWISV